MKHKQNGSAHIIIIGIFIVLISGSLTYIFLNKLSKSTPEPTVTVSEVASQPDGTSGNDAKSYVSFEDWRVRFKSDTTYTLKRNSAIGSGEAYFISVEALANTCANPNTPWLGTIQKFDNPEAKQTVGPDAGKTMDQIFGSKGITINGTLYYFDANTQFCRRNTSNPEIDQAAKTLESEMKSLEAY